MPSAGVNAGKLCEAVLRLVQNRVTGYYTPFTKSISDFAEQCRLIIAGQNPGSISDAEKKVLPRALVFLYTMRNTRGIAHVGGDVDANSIDSATIERVANWIVCELIRIHHQLSLDEAQDIVDLVAVRRLPDIWEVGGKKRILRLREGMKIREAVFLLLYSAAETTVYVEDLVS
jgi:hypothetical protein